MILAAPPAPPLAFLGSSGINANVEFTDTELQEIARSVRGSARLRREDAKAQAGSSVAGIAAADADRLEQIAAKCERMRENAPPDNVVRLRPGADHVCNKNGEAVEVISYEPTCSVCGVPQVFD